MHQPPVVIKTPWLPYVKFARPPYIAVRKEKKKGVPTTLHSIKSPSVVLTLERKFTHTVRKVHAHYCAVSFRLHCAQNASGVSWYRWSATQCASRGALTHLHWSPDFTVRKSRDNFNCQKRTRDAVYRNDCTSFSPEPVLAPTCRHTMHAMKLTGKMQAINAKHGSPISIKVVLRKRPSKSCWEFHIRNFCTCCRNFRTQNMLDRVNVGEE